MAIGSMTPLDFSAKRGGNLEPYFETENGVLYHGDCLTIMPQLEPVDLVLTDPPYGLGEKWQGGKSKWPLHHGQMAWDATIVLELPQIIQIGRQQIVWGGHLYPLPQNRCWLVWDKLERNDQFTAGQAEMAWTNLDRPIRVFRRCSTALLSSGKIHPTQKPVELMVWCMQFTTGQTVLDPFLGSGTTAVACEQLGRRWIGIEISEKYCEIAAKRIERERQQLKLFPPTAPKPRPVQNELF